MDLLSSEGQLVLNGKNFVSHTRVYVNNILKVDTSAGVIDTPVISYQINRSRKLGAAKLILNVANPEGIYSYKRQDDPVFGYSNKIKLQEGIPVGTVIEWFTRFVGVIVSQVPVNTGGMPSLNVLAMDNMKILLDYLPDEIYYCPDSIPESEETLTEVEGSDYMHYSGNKNNLPWVDIPYPIFYKNGEKVKENYEVDLVNGEVYFGEKMCTMEKNLATRVTDTQYTISSPVKSGFKVLRSFKMQQSLFGQVRKQDFNDNEIPDDVTVTYSGNTVTFSKSPFWDLDQSGKEQYISRKIYIVNETPCTVTADYWYYDDNTNLAENVIRDLALKAGFLSEQINLDPTNVSLKPLRFTNLTIKSGFEAIQKIKQQLSPGYIITCDTEGNLRGCYTKQEQNEIYKDYDLQLIKKIEAPVSEENLYTVIVAHGLDLNPNDLRNGATGQNLLEANSIITVEGTPDLVFNKKADDQMSWHWIKKNDDNPPEFPIDLMTITLAEAQKVKEINILVGEYNGGTIEESISVQASEDGVNWFYIDRSSRGVSGASSQWMTVSGGELENRKIKGIKFIIEAGFNWNESHTYSERSGFLGLGTTVVTDNYYHWYAAIKEVQIWQENTIAVTTALCNCIGIGDGANKTFTIPNAPIAADTVVVYRDGVIVAPGAYTIDYASGEVVFLVAPQGVITADYTALTKQQARTQSTNDVHSINNVTVVNPELLVPFAGGAISVGSANYKLLKKIGLKKNAMKIDNYLNSFLDVKTRGEEMLNEISRLEETLNMDVVYRPDIDICQTVGVTDNRLGVDGLFFVEEITESKQGYRPSLNVKVSSYKFTKTV